jgi:hypothetical protein
MSSQDRERRRVTSARDRAEKHTSGFESTSIKVPDGVKRLKLKEGVMYIDIIPYEVGEGNPFADKGALHYERTFYIHRDIGPGGDSYVCLHKTNKERCPICEYRGKMARDPDADPDQIKGMAPKERQMFNVIDCKDRDSGIQLMELSYHLFGKLLDARISADEDDEGWENFHDPVEGKTLKLTVVKKKMGQNEFCEVTAIDLKERKETYKDSIVDKAHCLDDLIRLLSYDKLKAILLQVDGDDKKKEDDEDRPKKRRDEDEDERPKKKAADEDEDRPKKKSSDDDEDRPKKKADDDDDWDAKPKKKSSDDDDERPKKKALDDDDEPPRRKRDEDEEDRPRKKADDDDEAPKKKRALDDDDERPKKKASEDDDERPKKRRDDDDEAPKKKKDDDDDWGDETPKKKSSDDDDAPRRKRDDDDEAPRKRRSLED